MREPGSGVKMHWSAKGDDSYYARESAVPIKLPWLD